MAGRELSLPDGVAAAIWRGDELAAPSTAVVATGFDDLDRELPGGGWPVGCVTELLQPQYSLAEIQLLLPAVGTQSGPLRQVVVIGAPHQPFLAGWRAWGISEAHVLVVHPHTPAEGLWVTEQAVRADGIGAAFGFALQRVQGPSRSYPDSGMTISVAAALRRRFPGLIARNNSKGARRPQRRSCR